MDLDTPIIQACYINGKTCRNGKRDDFEINPATGERFHCNKWIKLVGYDPQTGQAIDTWCCSELAKIKIGLETAQMERQTGASVDKVANQIQRQRAEFLGALPTDAVERLEMNAPRLTPEAPRVHP